VKLGFATDGDLRLGIPVYKITPALAARRYFDDKGLRDYLAGHVHRNGGKKFFASSDWKRTLMKIADEYEGDSDGLKGFFEGPDEQTDRIMKELVLTKATVEKMLNKRCDYICWPWGAVTSLSAKLARAAGFTGGIGMKQGSNNIFTDKMDIRRRNPCGKDIKDFASLL
jgi:hypothetical protein